MVRTRTVSHAAAQLGLDAAFQIEADRFDLPVAQIDLNDPPVAVIGHVHLPTGH
ncbi:unnamed protein product, partial [marine sediment metagenome]